MAFKVFFGDFSASLLPSSFEYLTGQSVLREEPFFSLAEEYSFRQIHLARQVHGVEGFVVGANAVDDKKPLVPYEADYLMSNEKGRALVVLTADCLPLVLYDRRVQAFAVVHAGWRGTVAGIVPNAVRTLHNEYGTDPSDLRVFFGPCAKVCCYQVASSFFIPLEHDQLAAQARRYEKEKTYFDLVVYNQLLLKREGVEEQQCDFFNNRCTICTPGYCSYRAQGGTKLRNVTLASLK